MARVQIAFIAIQGSKPLRSYIASDVIKLNMVQLSRVCRD